MFNYSIIIPHYNNADDLQRCLDSIPNRNDVQVIVVDDNSDPTKVDFEHFPGLGRPNTEIVFSKGKDGKGPGYARNVGIDRAQGRWVVFCDSDDYLLPEASAAMDEYANHEADVVFFKCAKQNLEDLRSDYLAVNNLIDASSRAGCADNIAYGFPCPWGKFIKKDFLLQNGIRFQQITGGDDILFSVRIAIALERYALSDTQIYCVVDRPGSLTRNNQWQGFRSYTLACCEAYKLMKPVWKEKMAYSWTASWWGFLWAENKPKALQLLPKVSKAMGWNKALHCLKKATKVGAWNWKNREE